jgi:hypothetical protein
MIQCVLRKFDIHFLFCDYGRDTGSIAIMLKLKKTVTMFHQCIN